MFYSHFLEESSNLGHIGVRFFFVLSGFLITNILLDAREQDHHAAGITVFFARRAARIWPPYFLTLAFCALAAGALRLEMMMRRCRGTHCSSLISGMQRTGPSLGRWRTFGHWQSKSNST
ncbi:acyltransferase family protein [Rhizobium leguminosarum]|uniref:acyltransferase family protein n=1 Tax=Rhizobium leguminosarum TaxID=384 RepID=UPI003F9DF031